MTTTATHRIDASVIDLEPGLQAERSVGATTPQPSRRFKISGDHVNAATALYSDDERREIRWLHSFMVERDRIPAEVGPMLKKDNGDGYSSDSVYQLLTGVREAGIGKMVQAIARLRKIEEERSKIVRAPFVKTKLAERVWKVCQAALIYQKVCFIIGASQIGKTTALERYAADHNHGETIYVEMPNGGNMGDFLVALAEALRISPYLTTRELRRRIKRAFDSRMLLIVDQAHEPFQNERATRLPLPLLFVMEIYNASKCGVVLSGTDVLQEGIKDGTHSKVMRQLNLRSLSWQRLPDAPSEANLVEFANSYGLAPASGEALKLQALIIKDWGLGRWCTILMAASRLAEKKKRDMIWKDVLEAHAGLVAMEKTEDLE